jgi:gamma-glutamyl:cysteine ligase YbdK (ATP-grasp superfamily)
MLEAAATAFQIHLKVSPDQAGRIFNASKILSAPIAALSANSPYLLGADLWDETRVPLFEQAVDVGGTCLSKRVNFGIRYIHKSISEVFQANLHRYPTLLPQLFDEPDHCFAHLSLHNGTIWRWNRPILGFDDDGAPHLRIEHRVPPSGPTLRDSIANAAFYYGAVQTLASAENPPEQAISFETCSSDFYAAARHGLGADCHWLSGARGNIRELLLKQLLPLAHQGLEALGIAPAERRQWLGLIEARLQAATNGSDWQRRWVAAHGHDMPALTHAYLERQQSGQPVHLWSI